ncbi:MAG: PhoH family protein [Methylococcaceae bacterium]|nr:MAG: PhoH family protein [Methylococcaceae bacterium]
MHDPTAIFRFKEHDIYIPMVVLEELDKAKKGLSELSRNVRQVSRFLDELIQHMDLAAIADGIPLLRLEYAARIDGSSTGRLFLQVRRLESPLPAGLAGEMPDNSILGAALALAQELPDTQVILVSKDINLRIKAAMLAIRAEDYHNDQVLDDINLLYSGMQELPQDFWHGHGGKNDTWQADNRRYYRVRGPLVAQWSPCTCVYLPGDTGFEAMVRQLEGDSAVLELARNFREEGLSVWGVHARNREQNFALNVLTDPDIDFVTLLGSAGTGKTLLALAVGLAATLDEKKYREIIMTRETIPLGEDIGFLPGTEEEKMAPWMGALLDNLELLASREENPGSWEKAVTQDVLLKRVKVRSLNFMRGRTFLNRYIILDEAQNLTPKQMKTLITRAGPGSKIVCIGNIGQIDSPYLTGTTSGLTYAVDRFKAWPHAAHITLQRGERSRLADYASEHL